MTLPTLLKRRGIENLSTPGLLSDFLTDPFFSTDLAFMGTPKNVPYVNIKETDNEYVLELAAPGMKKDDFHVNIENNSLNIWAENEQTSEKNENNYTRKEYSYNSFSRSFALPESIKGEEVKAHYENGILEVRLPKNEKSKAKSRTEIKIS